jgi:hypothetical protein
MRANFRTATLAAWKAYPGLVRGRADGQGERPPGALPRASRRIPTLDQAGWRGEKTPPPGTGGRSHLPHQKQAYSPFPYIAWNPGKEYV